MVLWANNEPGGRYVQGVITTPGREEMLGAYKSVIQDPFYISDMNTSSSVYYPKLRDVTLKAGTEKLSAYANDVSNYIEKVSYYVNGQWVNEGKFPSFDASVDFSSYAGQTVTLTANYEDRAGNTLYQDDIQARVAGDGVNPGTNPGPQPSGLKGYENIPDSDKRVEMFIGKNTMLDNGQQKSMDAAPYISSSRTYVPLRALAEVFGAQVNWDGATRTVTVSDGTNTVQMVIGSTDYSVNGQQKTMDVAPEITGDRTYMVVRYVAEALGYGVYPISDSHGVYSVVFVK